MTTTRFLDLDPIRTPLGTFRLGGTDYLVWPLRLYQLINIAQLSTTSERSLSSLLDELCETIPECPRETLERMDIAQLNALSAWIQEGGSPEEAQKNGKMPVDEVALPASTSP